MLHTAQNVFSSQMNSTINALSKESWVKHTEAILFRDFPPIVLVSISNLQNFCAFRQNPKFVDMSGVWCWESF